MTNREAIIEIAKRAKTQIIEIMIPAKMSHIRYDCELTDSLIDIMLEGDNKFTIYQNGYWVTTIEA